MPGLGEIDGVQGGQLLGLAEEDLGLGLGRSVAFGLRQELRDLLGVIGG